MKEGGNHLLIVGRLGVGDSGTLGPRPTHCQSAYAPCEGGVPPPPPPRDERSDEW